MTNLSKLEQELPLLRVKAIQLFGYLVLFAFGGFDLGKSKFKC